MKYEFLKEGSCYYEIKFGKPDEGELFKIAVELVLKQETLTKLRRNYNSNSTFGLLHRSLFFTSL